MKISSANTETLSGFLVALPTPFSAEQSLDLEGFNRLARRALAGGAAGLVVLGAAAESAALEDVERDVLLEAAVQVAGTRPVLAGTGSCSTRQAIAWTRRARQLGAAAALVVTPYYLHPTQSGLVSHYRAIADSVPDFPLLAHNDPHRTGVTLEPSTLRSLWRIPEVAGLLESDADLGRIACIADALPRGKVLLTGDDRLIAAGLAQGAQGVVSEWAGAFPEWAAQLVQAALRGRRDEALAFQDQLRPLTEALRFESSPVPLKALLKRLGLCGDHVRLPLVPATPGTRTVLAAALHRAHVA